MPIRKRGKKWAYYFDPPGSSREGRTRISESGFASKKEAVDAEATRRLEVTAEYEARARGVVGNVPHTLSELIQEFCAQHGDKELGQKTVFRYREMAEYLAKELLASRASDLTPLHFTREWRRLQESGGHHRRTKAPRPLSGKTVRNIAGMVSSAYTFGIGQGILTINPVSGSTKPRAGEKRLPIALTQEQTELLMSGTTHWYLADLQEVSAALGTRRGETLALRWSDLVRGRAVVTRTLCQVKDKVFFKEAPKTKAGFRKISIPESTLAILDRIREQQQVYRDFFGPDYQDQGLIFCEDDGTPLRPDSVSAAASYTHKRLKLPKGSNLHGLRHTHASQLIAGGVDIPTVSARLGHSSPATTMRIYAHMIEGRDEVAAKLWDAMRKPAKSGTTEETDKPN